MLRLGRRTAPNRKSERTLNNPGNNLLRALREKDYEALQPHLKEVHAARGAVLHEPGDLVNSAYFPCGSSLVALTVLLRDGKSVETNLFGREGAVGGAANPGQLPAFAKASVLFPGKFLVIKIAELEKAKSRSPELRRLLAIYSDCLIAQLLQSAACNACHPIEQRAAKWLLYALDRTGTDEIPLTQEQLANMLGVGRSYMTRVIQRLKDRGVLETARGSLRVRDTERLHESCCGCRDAVRHHFDAVLKGVYPAPDKRRE
jgi:CRP-like cAMP-binding protein